MKITVGDTGSGLLRLDVDTLMRTRLLIQANSGGGKSFLLRRLAEQLFGKVQVIIIDPEGEFSSLREKFGYVLVGQGGETPADVRSAGLVAEKLLELNASAVCDIFEAFRKNSQGRHTWVKTFCNALLDAPKKLWHPVVLIIDEAHKYCPEGKSGESEASEAVIGVGTAGRKRGICLVLATQRLGKLRKDVSAELLNRLIGPTFEDVDLERAADLLSVTASDKREFFTQMRVLEPGNFYALGRALCKERTLVKVGDVETTHPEIGKANYSLAPPPTPDKVKALLPKLGDLPKQAEERQRTVEGLEAELRSAKAKLREQVRGGAPIDEARMKREIERARIDAETKAAAFVAQVQRRLSSTLQEVAKAGAHLIKLGSAELPAAPVFEYATRVNPPITVPVVQHSPARVRHHESPSVDGERKLGACERAIASFLWSNADRSWSKQQVGIMTGYSPNSGGFSNALSYLAARGIISRADGRLQVSGDTPEGLQHDQEFSVDNIKRKLGKCELEIFEVVLANADREMTKEEIAEMTPSQYSPGSGGFSNSLSALNSLGCLHRKNGRIRLSDDAKELI